MLSIRARIQKVVPVASSLYWASAPDGSWWLQLPMGSDDNKYPIHLPPRYPSKDLARQEAVEGDRQLAWCSVHRLTFQGFRGFGLRV
jgi:hypothetical protein